MRPRHLMLAALALIGASAACTLILDRDKTQCSTNGDCAHFGAGAACVDSVCVAGGDVVGADGPNGEGGGDGGPDGCKTPTTNDELLNACTNAQCVPFDNCTKLGACDGNYLGTVDPDAGTTSSAGADGGGPSCEDTIAGLGGTPIYVTGSSNFPAFLKLVAPLLATEQKYVIWQQTNSCTGVDTVFNVDPAKRVIKDATGKANFYYDATGNPQPCMLNGGQHEIDVGESDVFSAACAQKLGYTPDLNVPAAVGEYFGPIQTMTYIVPPTSSQTVISAEAAQAVFGRGGVPDGNKLPWSDPAQFFTRADSTGTNQMLSRAMNVDPTKWWGIDKKSASGMAAAIKAVPPGLAEKTIGVLSTDTADSERGNIKILAFQAHGQKCGYWPDSTPFAKDKQNVRDGHYPIWGYLHFYTRLQGGAPTAAAGSFVLRFALPKLDQSLVDAISQSGNIPACAMRVSRKTEMGPLEPYDSTYDCDCFFDAKTKGPDKVDPACKACSTAQDCPDTRPACNYGYCELH